jgi:ABC-type polysaccharide/polyol phosphate transport system ATPase subunit
MEQNFVKTTEYNDNVAIKVNHIAKTFKLPTERSNGLKQSFINFTKGIKGYKEQKVLRDIDFTVKKGDFFGIVGRNGSGKSTLLKIISGIYEPTSGNVDINGSLVSFIELGVGFNPELTGRENVYLNGALLGFSRNEIDKMYGDIVKFAELENFMEQKLKNYSSGMQVRLAFSCAIQAKSDILVLDEVLAVGDEAFQRKSAEFFAKIKQDKNKTVILVTHSMASVRQYCNRAIFIEKGKIVNEGNPNEVADDYSEMFLEESSQKIVEASKMDEKKDKKTRLGSGEIRFDNIKYKLTRDKFILDFDIVNHVEQDFYDITMGFDFMINKDITAGFDTRFTDDFAKIELKKSTSRHFTMNFANTFGNHKWELAMNMTTNYGNNIVDHIKPVLEFQSNNLNYHPVFKVLNVPKIMVSGENNE